MSKIFKKLEKNGKIVKICVFNKRCSSVASHGGGGGGGGGGGLGASLGWGALVRRGDG